MDDPLTIVSATLFAPTASGEPALFNSQSDLARAIASQKGSIYHNRAPGVRALLQQVLAGKRKFPTELEQGVIAAARERSASESRIGRVLADIEKHNNVVVPALRRGDQPVIEPLDQIAALQAHASQVLIFNSLPLELQPDLTGTPKQLREYALQAFLDEERTAEYTFCVPRRDLAVGLWRTWYKRIAGRSGAEQAGSILASWESKPEPESNVYVLPDAYCLHPLVVFNMKERDRSSHAGFIWYTKHDERAILRIPDVFLEGEWKESVYMKLRRNEIPEQKHVTWTEVRAEIEQGAM